MLQTAYLKLIDWWLLFCLFAPFAVFLLEIYWELNRSKVEFYLEGTKNLDRF